MPVPTFAAVVTSGCHANVVNALPQSTLFKRAAGGRPGSAVLALHLSTWTQAGVTFFVRHPPNRQFISKVQHDLLLSLLIFSMMVPLTLSSCFVVADRASGRLSPDCLVAGAGGGTTHTSRE
jgi:hypothetical protein